MLMQDTVLDSLRVVATTVVCFRGSRHALMSAGSRRKRLELFPTRTISQPLHTVCQPFDEKAALEMVSTLTDSWCSVVYMLVSDVRDQVWRLTWHTHDIVHIVLHHIGTYAGADCRVWL